MFNLLRDERIYDKQDSQILNFNRITNNKKRKLDNDRNINNIVMNNSFSNVDLKLPSTLEKKLVPTNGNLHRSDKKTKSNFDKVFVIEIYSTPDEKAECIESEIIANTEIGLNLACKYHPGFRYIWSLDYNNLMERMKNMSKTTSLVLHQIKTLNLADGQEENPLNLTKRSKIIIVAQGSRKNDQIADLDSESFIECLKEDIGAKKIAELELVVCNLGKNPTYIQEIQEIFKKNNPPTNIISYTCLLSANTNGEIVGFANDEQKSNEFGFHQTKQNNSVLENEDEEELTFYGPEQINKLRVQSVLNR